MQPSRLSFKMITVGIIFFCVTVVLIVVARSMHKKSVVEKFSNGTDLVPAFVNDYYLKYTIELHVNNKMLNQYKSEIDNGLKNLKEYARVVFKTGEKDVILHVNDRDANINDERALLLITCERKNTAKNDQHNVVLMLNCNIKKLNTRLFADVATFVGTYVKTML